MGLSIVVDSNKLLKGLQNLAHVLISSRIILWKHKVSGAVQNQLRFYLNPSLVWILALNHFEMVR